MRFLDLSKHWGLSGRSVSVGFLNAAFKPSDPDRGVVWELWNEPLPHTTTQYLQPDHGDEQRARDSVHKLFDLTRGVLKSRGSGCGELAKLASPALNQIIRPVTAKWYRLSLAGTSADHPRCREFRDKLAALQGRLRPYAHALAAMAIEDLTALEAPDL